MLLPQAQRPLRAAALQFCTFRSASFAPATSLQPGGDRAGHECSVTAMNNSHEQPDVRSTRRLTVLHSFPFLCCCDAVHEISFDHNHRLLEFCTSEDGRKGAGLRLAVGAHRVPALQHGYPAVLAVPVEGAQRQRLQLLLSRQHRVLGVLLLRPPSRVARGGQLLK